MRGWCIAMKQYSSLCEGTAALSLGVIDIGDGVPGRVQVDSEREKVELGGKQEKDKHEETDNERSSTHHGWHEDGVKCALRHLEP